MTFIVLPPPGKGHGCFRFKCDRIVKAVPINPKLPPRFDDTPNELRPLRHLAWWNVPFIQTEFSKDRQFVKHWGGSLRYDVRCLDGGAWDRSTCWGQYRTLSEAVAGALRGVPVWIIAPA